MKVGILSDTHFGYAWGTPRENDSFKQAKDALKKLLAERVDLIILAGDVFNVPSPAPEIWSRAIDVFSIAKSRQTNLRADVDPKNLSGTPIVTIHGGHERRTNKEDTALEALEKVGLLIHLHASKVTFEKQGEKLTVHGMSGVPERYARDVLKSWSPTPVPDSKNIFVLHQNLFPFVYTGNDKDGLKLADLPEGFDLYIDGHIHKALETNYGEAPVIITGSTVLTQMRKGEEGQKVAWIWNDGKIRQIPIASRPFTYLEIDATGKDALEIEGEIKKLVSNQKKGALVKIKITGKLKTGHTNANISIPKTDALISIDRSLDTDDAEPNARPLSDTAISLLSQKLSDMGFSKDLNISTLYSLLLQGALDEAAKLVEDVS